MTNTNRIKINSIELENGLARYADPPKPDLLRKRR